ncbi:Mediator of RNA polymerase II transcription subunit 9 [Sarcoptes scabiei]|uniref:Mediator of RNA polymerase II transcription subunit 9 n=1 Tax=Sarcoptes scabiei TaxID=52283 RepID=A0A834VGQ1_SARSC|nr:Mediator of RNA polymerase II transcription subunit 9 [Sarcoptes scabiei]
MSIATSRDSNTSKISSTSDLNQETDQTQPLCSSSELNVNFLPQIYDIIRCLEKEAQESTAPKSLILGREQPIDYAAKMLKLKESFEKIRNQLANVPGSTFTRDQQLQTIKSLTQQLVMKQKLLAKYKNSSLFDNINLKTEN